jgi:hypothetical protein
MVFKLFGCGDSKMAGTLRRDPALRVFKEGKSRTAAYNDPPLDFKCHLGSRSPLFSVTSTYLHVPSPRASQPSFLHLLLHPSSLPELLHTHVWTTSVLS